MLNDKVVLITGGTGSLGYHFVEYALAYYKPRKLIVYSRDEYKQHIMREKFRQYDDVMRFFIGDVRDYSRLKRAFFGVDYVVHAASLKQIQSCEYNPQEVVKTNIIGSQNVIEAALDSGVKTVISLSTDKAVNPVNLYGGSKYVADKLFIAANSYSKDEAGRFAVVRYGNVAGSRGSVIPFYRKLRDEGATVLPVKDYRMTRFWVNPDDGVRLIIKAMECANGGEIFIPKSPSFKITDLAQAIIPDCKMDEVGLSGNEKIQEVMVTKEEAVNTYEYDDFFVVYPYGQGFHEREKIPGGEKLGYGFEYNSMNNTEWLSVNEIIRLLTDIGDY